MLFLLCEASFPLKDFKISDEALRACQDKVLQACWVGLPRNELLHWALAGEGNNLLVNADVWGARQSEAGVSDDVKKRTNFP